MGRRSLVELPPGAEPPYAVFVNGVRQTEGSDYRVEGRSLVFDRQLAKEGKLGFRRWAQMFLSIVGTFRRHDSVDVQYRRDGDARVATDLEVTPLEEPGGPAGTVAREATGPDRADGP